MPDAWVNPSIGRSVSICFRLAYWVLAFSTPTPQMIRRKEVADLGEIAEQEDSRRGLLW